MNLFQEVLPNQPGAAPKHSGQTAHPSLSQCGWGRLSFSRSLGLFRAEGMEMLKPCLLSAGIWGPSSQVS